MNVQMLIEMTSYLFPTVNTYFSIPVFIYFIFNSILLLYLARQDLLYHEITKKQRCVILISLPLMFCCGYALYGVSIDLILGAFILAGYYYFVALFCQMKKNRLGFGGADILTAPLFTTWFGTGVIVFLILYLIILVITQLTPLRTYLNSFAKKESDKTGKCIPLIPILFITYILSFTVYFLG